MIEDKRSNSWLIPILHGFILIAILCGMALSILSWIGVCTEACREGHEYTLFGMRFEAIGVFYFVALLLSYILSWVRSSLILVTGALLAAGIGSEIMFLIIQKYMLAHWCPICLGIAASLLLATIAFAALHLQIPRGVRQKELQRMMLRHLRLTFAGLGIGFLGFFAAFFGVAKPEKPPLETTFEQSLVLGDPQQNVDVFFFTSWICPACRRFEPSLERLLPQIYDKASVIMVDAGTDDKTINYLPFNLTFMVTDKKNYIKLRHMLKEIADSTDHPTEEQVEKAMRDLDFQYQELEYANVLKAVEYYQKLAERFKITALPTCIVCNKSTHKEAKLEGAQITHTAILEAINKVK